MCRNRTEQLSHIQRNLVVYIHRKDRANNLIPIGTGFFISNNGTIMTAKHNIDFSTQCSFWALYEGEYYEINKKQGISYQYTGVDIIVVQAKIKLNLKSTDFLIDYMYDESALVAEEVVVIGYENIGKEIACATGTICKYKDGKYEIQNANLGSGNSGAPVVLKKDLKTLVGVMSKREGLSINVDTYRITSDKFGIGYAHAIKYFYKLSSVSESHETHLVCNLLNTMELNKWDEYFTCHIKKINHAYRMTPNPVYIYNTFFANYKMGSVNLIQLCEFMITNKIFLFSIAKLYETIGNILINSGIPIVLADARNYLKQACLVYENLDFCIDELVRRKIRVKWLIAISYKLERNYGESVRVCEDIGKTYKSECEKYQVPYSTGLILPEREIAVIEQQKGYFKLLKEKDYLYENDNIETFFTNRRIFEFLMHKYNIVEAKKILPSLMQSYAHCKYQLQPIYKFVLAKNLYQFYALSNKRKKADQYYNYAINSFERWGLLGQKNAILKLQDNLIK